MPTEVVGLFPKMGASSCGVRAWSLIFSKGAMISPGQENERNRGWWFFVCLFVF